MCHHQLNHCLLALSCKSLYKVKKIGRNKIPKPSLLRHKIVLNLSHQATNKATSSPKMLPDHKSHSESFALAVGMSVAKHLADDDPCIKSIAFYSNSSSAISNIPLMHTHPSQQLSIMFSKHIHKFLEKNTSGKSKSA